MDLTYTLYNMTHHNEGWSMDLTHNIENWNTEWKMFGLRSKNDSKNSYKIVNRRRNQLEEMIQNIFLDSFSNKIGHYG